VQPPRLLVRGYEVVIGFETHAQLSTRSKIFSRAATAFGAEPNTQACAVDLALPGTLPVMNRGAVERAIEFGLAVNSAHMRRAQRVRAQELLLPRSAQGLPDQPVRDSGGAGRRRSAFYLDGEKRSVRLVRAHLEEDAGKSLHEDFMPARAALTSTAPARHCWKSSPNPTCAPAPKPWPTRRELHKIVTWIGICDGNMQEGSFPLRCQRVGAQARRRPWAHAARSRT
jgi:aspartyl-tRNA(Asn)/glutamyl-tRNA(Gln) amidotransferase subunit B